MHTRFFTMLILFLTAAFQRVESLPADVGITSKMGISPDGKRLTYDERRKLQGPVYKDKDSRVRDIQGWVTFVRNIRAPDEFSRALESAHRHHITGKGVSVLIVESEFISPLLKKLEVFPGQITQMEPDDAEWREVLRKNAVAGAHGTAVVHVFLQIAPGASVYVVNTKALRADKEFAEKMQHMLLGEDIVAINASMGVSEEAHFDVLRHLMFANPKKPKLLVKAAGNHKKQYGIGAPLDLKFIKDSEVLDHMILVGSADEQSKSNVPGPDPVLQSNWISALGNAWFFREKEGGKIDPGADFSHRDFDTEAGTSFAAPTVTGAVTLLVEYAHKKYQHSLTAKEIKEILLQSARRTFQQPTTSGEMPRWHLDPEDVENKGREDFFGARKFDPARYGMGLLDIKNALVYTDLKCTHLDWDSKTLRAEMLKMNAAEEAGAATKIQRATKKFLAKKRA